MNINYEKIKNHTPGLMDFEELKKFAVAIPLIRTADDTKILFEERAHKMNHQPGDICFPGGKVEEGETPEEAALRELCEELLINPGQITLIGACDIYLTGKGAAIFPFVVELHDYHNTYSEDEVEELILIPANYFAQTQPEEIFTTIKEIPDEDFPFDKIYGGKTYPWREHRKRITFYHYGDKTIWGMTGRMIEAFAEMFLR